MRRRSFSATAALALSMPVCTASAIEHGRIALLAAGVDRARVDPLIAELRGLGYSEQDIEQHYEGLTADSVQQIARDVVRRHPDVIVTFSNVDVVSAKQATSKIPIVMVLSSLPVESGFITSLNRPGGNVTGTTLQSSEIGAKLIELLKQAAPRVSTVALLWEPGFPGMHLYYQQALRGAAALGVRYQEWPVSTDRELDAALDGVRRDRPNGLYVSLTGPLYIQRQRVIKLAAELRIPAIYTEELAVREGALMSYSADHAALMRRSAAFVDRILKGAKPSDLPIEEPTSFNLAINIATAEAIGVPMPQALLLRATTVVGK